MSWKSYQDEDKNISVDAYFYPVDGVQITVNVWDDNEDDYYTVVDSRFICESFHEAMSTALMRGCDFDYWQADEQCANWGIFPPDDEEDE
jgi:hypothetical protein